MNDDIIVSLSTKIDCHDFENGMEITAIVDLENRSEANRAIKSIVIEAGEEISIVGEISAGKNVRTIEIEREAMIWKGEKKRFEYRIDIRIPNAFENGTSINNCLRATVKSESHSVFSTKWHYPKINRPRIELPKEIMVSRIKLLEWRSIKNQGTSRSPELRMIWAFVAFLSLGALGPFLFFYWERYWRWEEAHILTVWIFVTIELSLLAYVILKKREYDKINIVPRSTFFQFFRKMPPKNWTADSLFKKMEVRYEQSYDYRFEASMRCIADIDWLEYGATVRKKHVGVMLWSVPVVLGTDSNGLLSIWNMTNFGTSEWLVKYLLPVGKVKWEMSVSVCYELTWWFESETLFSKAWTMRF